MPANTSRICSRLVTSILIGGGAPAHLTDLLARLLRVHDVLRREQLGEGRLRSLRGLLDRRVQLDEDVGDDDVGAGAGECQAVRPAQAARSSCDDGDLAGQIEHAVLLGNLVIAAIEELSWR